MGCQYIVIVHEFIVALALSFTLVCSLCVPSHLITSFVSDFCCLPIAVTAIVKELQAQLLSPTGQLHPLHVYTNAKIALESTLLQRMNRLSPAEFEQVLHPVFQVSQNECGVGGVGQPALSDL